MTMRNDWFIFREDQGLNAVSRDYDVSQHWNASRRAKKGTVRDERMDGES